MQKENTTQMPAAPPDVILEDQTLREGLQSLTRTFRIEEKKSLFKALWKAGLKWIQIGSFVHPARVPQMADTDRLASDLRRQGQPSDVHMSALVLNAKGLDRALACGVRHVNLSVSVSDTHSRKNAGQSASRALTAMQGVVRQANAAGLKLKAGLQCVFGCVYEGAVPTARVFEAAEALIGAGAQEINLADTTGMATPLAIEAMIAGFHRRFPGVTPSLHLHNTRGLGLTNMWTGFQAGVRHFDVCTGGLGGCPFVRGAAGNIPTEDAVHMFEAMNIRTAISLKALCHIVQDLETLLGGRLPGNMKAVLQANEDLFQ